MKNLLFLLLTCMALHSCENYKKKSTPEGTKKTTVTAPDNTATPSSKNDRLQGIDISHYQTNINWDEVKQDEISFVFSKATGGQTYVDPSFAQHWKDVKAANLMRGAYHFYYTKDDPTVQANFFISKVLPVYDKSDLPPVIDIETDGVNTDISIEQLQQDIKTFLAVVQKAFGRKPILYTSHAFAQKYFDNPDFDQYYLWLAEYDSATPKVPNGWAGSDWTFWQNSPSATVKGVEGKVDHDFFNGSLNQLQAL